MYKDNHAEEWDLFWKKRYDAMQDEYQSMVKENEMMFETMTKVKSHVSLGNIVEAVGEIKNLVGNLKEIPTASKQTKRRYKV